MRTMLFLSVSVLAMGITSAAQAVDVSTSEELVTAIKAGGDVNVTQNIILLTAMQTAGDNLVLTGNNHILDGDNHGRAMIIKNGQKFSAENVFFKALRVLKDLLGQG